MKSANRTILITGASRRVGRQMALYLARRGHHIAIHCRKEDKDSTSLVTALDKLGVRSAVIAAELSDAKQLTTIVSRARKVLGSLSVLINNAALFEKDNLATLAPEQFNAHMGINLYAPMVLARDFRKQASKTADNCIINIVDSCVGLSISPNYLSYAISRGALEYFTRLTAQEFAPTIRINAVSPGLTLAGKQDTPQSFARLAKRSPLMHASSPEEVCTALGFLLDSPSITGQVIALSGGMDMPFLRQSKTVPDA